MTTWVLITTQYNSQQLHADNDYFNSPHKDSGLFTVLLLKPATALMGWKLLISTRPTRLGVKQSANMRLFQLSLMPGEVVVLADIAVQRLLGADRVRACVPRVRRPAAEDAVRLSIAIVCGSPWCR